MTTPAPAAHFELCAYVGAGGVVHPSAFEGVATHMVIRAFSPSEARYAVVRGVSVLGGEPDAVYLCWDLHEASGGWPTLNPTPKWTASNPDALIMKAIALYGQD